MLQSDRNARTISVLRKIRDQGAPDSNRDTMSPDIANNKPDLGQVPGAQTEADTMSDMFPDMSSGGMNNIGLNKKKKKLNLGPPNAQEPIDQTRPEPEEP